MYISGMSDSIGGSGKVNNFLATLYVKTIPRRNLQKTKRRAGTFIEAVAESSFKSAAQSAFEQEMRYLFAISMIFCNLYLCLHIVLSVSQNIQMLLILKGISI